MGRALQGIALTPNFHIAPEDSDHFQIDEDWFSNLDDLPQKPEAVIDFSTPEGCLNALDYCVENKIPLVTGTTGLSDSDLQLLKIASEKIAILHAANFSVGIHLLARAVAQLAEATQAGEWDIEIFEAHHRNKIDAPGGTALFLGDLAVKHRNLDPQNLEPKIRLGNTGKRTDEEIGFQVLRGGSIVGTHRVAFCGEGEIVELTHQALDRTIFARGAFRAAYWLRSQEPGLYDMEDVLFS